MGSFNKTNTNSHSPSTKTANVSRSKGERLGWASVSEQKKRSLREVVGNGEEVDRKNYSNPTAPIKLLVP